MTNARRDCTHIRGPSMKMTSFCAMALFAAISIQSLTASGDGLGQQKPTVKIPEPGVPEIMTIEGTWVRAAYNNEGYAILGYRLANMSVGEEWMLLEFGTTVR